MIDDDEEDFMLLRMAFQQHAPWVCLTWFESSHAFLDSRVWQQHPIHLFVFDLLVGENDPHWQSALRQQVGCEAIPMVIHSGSEAPGDRELMLDEGAVDFLVKASTPNETKQTVEQMVVYLV
jgi:CheY-like chemotaxis protein